MSSGGIQYRVRGSCTGDLEALFELSAFLDTVNLPHDRRVLAKVLARSEASFGGEIEEPGDRLHLLVVEDSSTRRLVGASMVIAQLGTKRAPYVYFERGVEERYSRILDRHFRHETLQIRYVYDGPTELGGLIVRPSHRASPARVGRLAAYARFALIAARRAQFRDECLAELLPPRRPDGGSDFWDAVGRLFTGLEYAEADRLSRSEKEFIRELFPEAHLYLSLLSPEARAPVGRVAPETEPARALLESIGFQPTNRVDPFDGGPHFLAKTDAIVPVAGARHGSIATLTKLEGDGLIARFIDTPPWMLAVSLPAQGLDRVRLVCEALETDENSRAVTIPYRNRP